MANWATINKRRKMRESGSEDRGAASGDAPTVLASLFRAESARSARLDHYLAHGPRGERDVEALLNAKGKERLPSGQTRDERDAWLRGILGPYKARRAAGTSPMVGDDGSSAT